MRENTKRGILGILSGQKPKCFKKRRKTQDVEEWKNREKCDRCEWTRNCGKGIV